MAVVKTLCCIAFTFLCTSALFGQFDTTYMGYDRLLWSDVEQANGNAGITKVIAGLRKESNLEDLPFTVYVITAEEIKEQGYFTLVDAIRHLPGIRVSQPGSALDGETFMMRGLYGNSYAKILINDISVRPSTVGAMPLGSQLPIRHAERIEVIYGPAATLYGADAASGVINIILKDSEYPSFAQADIEVGENVHSRLSAMFGGKLAIGTKTLQLKMYGGFTSFNDRRIKYDLNNLYNPEVYEEIIGLNFQDLVQYEQRPNYIGETGAPVLANLPHLSSYIGFSASIGSFEFQTQRLYRRDHSSIGLSPYAVSYADPQSTFGEEILTSSILFRKNFEKWDLRIKASGLLYTIDPLSSYRNVIPTFGVITNAYSSDLLGFRQGEPIQNGPARIDSAYLSGPRYVSGNSSDFSIDAYANIAVSDVVSIAAGIKTFSGFGDAIERFNSLPGSLPKKFIRLPSVQSARVLLSEGIAFLEAYLNYGTFQAVIGTQLFARSDSLVTNTAEFNPRIGIQYKVSPRLSLRASYSTAFRYPSAFFSGSTYQVSLKDDFIEVVTGSPNIEPERTISIETGLRYSPSQHIYLDASIFYTRTSNFINYNFNRGRSPGSLLWGYQNDPNSFARLIGMQVGLQIKNILPAIKFDTDFNLSFSRGKERILSISLADFEQIRLQDIPVVRAQPDFIGHIRMSFQTGRYFKFFLNHSFMTKSWTRNKLRITRALAINDTAQLQNNGYYALSVRSLFKISRQLNAYLGIANFFNTHYAGIDASFEPDVLLYNPQHRRSIRFGVNFSFN